VSPC